MENELIERPHCPDAERALIAHVFLDSSLVTQLPPAHRFYKYRIVAEAIHELAGQSIAPDGVRVVEHLRAKHQLEQVGGSTAVLCIDSGIPCHGLEGMSYNARMVNRMYEQREAESAFYYGMERLRNGELASEVAKSIHKGIRARANECNNAPIITGCYSASELLSADVREPEGIFAGATRGQVGAIIAVTNIGKTTEMLNVAVALAAGELCPPLVTVASPPRKVCFLDFESTAGELQQFVDRMLGQVKNSERAKANLILYVDAMVRDEPLDLSNATHFKYIERSLSAHNPDLVIVDTASAAFSLTDENANAEITRRVMRPLKALARTLGAAVWFSHHRGKSNETQSSEKSYHGRGASAFGGLSRWVLNLERASEKGPDYVVLSSSKSKGASIEPTLLQLNRDTGWFEVCADQPSVASQLTAQDVATFILERMSDVENVTTKEVKKRFSGFGERTVDNRLNDASRLGLIEPVSRGHWRAVQAIPIDIENVEAQKRKADRACAVALPNPGKANVKKSTSTPNFTASLDSTTDQETVEIWK